MYIPLRLFEPPCHYRKTDSINSKIKLLFIFLKGQHLLAFSISRNWFRFGSSSRLKSGAKLNLTIPKSEFTILKRTGFMPVFYFSVLM
jgi:hypothetical protein